jgi:hypothetical protein
MKHLYLSCLVLLLLVASVRADEIDNIAMLIKQGNAQKLSELFAPMIELTINDDDKNCSKAQATEALAQFFNAHKPVSAQLMHKVNTGKKFVCGMVVYNSSNGVFRFVYTLDISGSNSKLIELRIEPEKAK